MNPSISAFPVNTSNNGGAGAFPPDPGMTLRDFFAAHALSGMLASGHEVSAAVCFIVSEAYVYADEMLRIREYPEGQP